MAYVDRSLRAFFEKYGEQEWFRNSLFVFVADHVSSEKFSEEFRTSPGDYHVVGFMYAPDSSLVGEHRQVVSQIDLMPTVLGLMGNEEPYFAFGRDIFAEHSDEPFSLNYDNNVFQAITSEYVVHFDEKQIVGVYRHSDLAKKQNLATEVDLSALEQKIKAMIQSYYSRIEAKDYVVHDEPASEE